MTAEKPSQSSQGERIKFVRKLNEMTQENFAAVLGTTRGAVGNWELGKGIAVENLKTIADRFQVSLGWLVSDRGQPPKNKADLSHLESDHVLNDEPPHDVDSPQGISTARPYRAKLPNASPVMSARVSAGPGAMPPTIVAEHGGIVYAADAIEGEISMPASITAALFPAPASRVHWLSVRGDSMEPTLSAGDLVGINTTDTRIASGGIFAFRDHDGDVLVKRLAEDDDRARVRCLSDNPKQPSFTRRLDEVEIFGRIVARIARVG